MRYLLLFSLLLGLAAGCGPSEEVKLIRKLRNESNPLKAREFLLDELQKDPSRMDLWRELAAVNCEAARSETYKHDPFELIVQSCLICAAYLEYDKSPGERWKAVGVVSANRAIGDASRQANEVDRSQAKVESRIRELVIEQIRSNMDTREREDIEEEILSRPLVDEHGRPLVDPLAAREVVWRCQFYASLIPALRGEDDTVAQATLRELNDKLDRWPTFSDLDPSFVTDIRAEADGVLQELLENALGDLKRLGYYTTATMLDPDIQP